MKYCEYCGAAMYDEAVMCPSCKKPVLFQLTVEMGSDVIGRNPSINVDIDGQPIKKMKKKEKITVKLTYGFHNIRFYAHSHEKNITVNLIRNIKLLVGVNRLGGGIEVYENKN